MKKTLALKSRIYPNNLLLKQIRHIQIVQCLNTLCYMPIKQALKQFKNFLKWKNKVTLASISILNLILYYYN